MSVTYQVGAPPAVEALCDLRVAVGWDRAERDYPAAFGRYATCVAAYGPRKELVGWCAAVSDGVRHAFLLDVIVDPGWRRRGIGSALVAHALEHQRALGITIFHADFAAEHGAFYEHCGFRSSAAGVLRVGDPPG